MIKILQTKLFKRYSSLSKNKNPRSIKGDEVVGKMITVYRFFYIYGDVYF